MWHSLGKVTVATAGTPVQITSTHTTAQTIFFQQVTGNTGMIWICNCSDADTSTGEGVVATLPAPVVAGGIDLALPYTTVNISGALEALNVSNFWVDADNDGESCQVSYVRP